MSERERPQGDLNSRYRDENPTCEEAEKLADTLRYKIILPAAQAIVTDPVQPNSSEADPVGAHGGHKVAALYVDPRGPYPKLLGPEMCWDEERDARNYAGPWPVVAHPPCGPWGRLRHMYRGSEHELAPLAVEQVRKWGGVLEHPADSLLWPECGLSGWTPNELGVSIEVEQVAWGHVARKRTWLYLVGVDIDLVQRTRLTGGTPTHHISRDAKRARRNGYTLKRTSSAQNRRTPPAFAEWLVSLAATATPTEPAR